MTAEAEDFELFKSECMRWVNYFGLHDYRVAFANEVTSDTTFAQCSTSLPDRTVVFRLAPSEGMNELNKANRDIKRDAFHEVVHLMLAFLLYLAECRFLEGNEIRAEEEKVVRILENTVYRDLG